MPGPDGPRPPDTDPVVEEYVRLASRYDVRWRYYVQRSAEETLTALPLQPGDHLLDVGCGTGVLLGMIAAGSPEVRLTGIDPVVQMLMVARRRLPDSIELREGRAERLPFADGTFDAVSMVSVFHLLTRQQVALAEVRRVLRPGGRLVITDWCADFLGIRLLHRFFQHRGRPHGRAWREEELLSFLGTSGYSVEVGRRYRISPLWGLMTLRARA